MTFEVIVPEGAIAILSQRWAQRGRFGNVTEVLDTFDREQLLVIAFVAIGFITTIHCDSVLALCPAPRDADGGGGLLSFSAWYVSEGWGICGGRGGQEVHILTLTRSRPNDTFCPIPFYQLPERRAWLEPNSLRGRTRGETRKLLDGRALPVDMPRRDRARRRGQRRQVGMGGGVCAGAVTREPLAAG